MEITKEWFVDWFDSKYYHILYKDRDYNEAENFMKNLISFLKLKKNGYILDLACGKGRHSIFLNKIGYKVKGFDLSKNNINFAKKFENENLKFKVHDMRNAFAEEFDGIFNLFTSFGYFNDDKTNIKILKNIKSGLKPNGIAVIDFMNVVTVKKRIVPKETITKNNIEFNITRYIRDNKIIKNIEFLIDNNNFNFTEKVQCLTLNTIKKYINEANLKLKHTFGNYQLDDFNLDNSDRLILVLEK